jgi:SAM-dependent methyltransferase
MLRAEADWIAAQLSRIADRDLSPLLNVGSSTGHSRAVRQPWMEGTVFAPLRERGVAVTHLDQKAAGGVDVIGDLMDAEFLRALTASAFRSILCSNVLEHVDDRVGLCARLQELVPPGGHLLVTVPRRFPYHPDPIDTRFRPSVEELAALFPELQVIVADEVDSGSFFQSLRDGWPEVIARIGWLFLPFVRPRGWLRNLHRLSSIGMRYSVTCALLGRPRS